MIKITIEWLASRVVLVSLAGITVYCGYFYPGLALLVIGLQSTIHEFIHAIFTKLTGGKVEEIYLRYPGPYVDFTANGKLSERIIYASGFLFDLVCVSFASVALLLSDGNIFKIGGIAIVLLSIFYHVMPEDSDYNLCTQRTK